VSVMFSYRTQELWVAVKQLFDVDPFEKPIEKLFRRRQADAGQMLLGLASATAFLAFSFFSLVFLLEADRPDGAGLVRLLITALSFYFALIAYCLLFERGSLISRDALATSFAYVIVLSIPFLDLFRPLSQVGYDVIVTASAIISISAISRLSHKKACVWLFTVVFMYFTVKLHFFGILGPDADQIAMNRSAVQAEFLVIQRMQILQACLFAYLVFRVNEARERVLFLRERQLEKNAEDRLHLLQGIGHDLRQPMTALMLHSDFARQRAESADYKQMGESLRVIEDNLHVMNSELTQVTELAAAADPSGNFVLKPVFILDTLNSLTEAFAPRAKGSKISLKRFVADKAENVFVFSDDLLIRRCLSNLISNAFKFTEKNPDENPKVITVGLTETDSYAELYISDTGIGIAPENLEKIWEPFFQIGNPARNSEMGFGLGLAHVRAAIDRMPGHSISVSSTLAEGTTFTIRVPLSHQIEESQMLVAAAPSDNALSGSNDWEFEGSLILLVEDDVLLRSSLSLGFESWGARVAEADCVEAAKRLIDSLEVPPDFAIVDFRLPDGDARDVFKYIEMSRSHTEGCTCHWVCLTGEHSTNLKKLEGTKISVVRKPVNLAGLRNRLIEIATTSGV
jgi:signal transduction histidine kinase/CheY-like chemotaxis protein